MGTGAARPPVTPEQEGWPMSADVSDTAPGETSARLGPAERAASFERLGRETFDVVVIGGGVVGAGAALDAVTRGLSVALVEARDLASGTSSRSSKLFHGGLRYLEMFEFGLVREALRERELMLTKICPHLAKPVSFLYPLSKPFVKESDRVAGVRVRDVETGAETDVKARVVINSSGVWTDELQRLSGGRGRFRVRASKGVHLVVARDRITSESGIILKTEKSVLFVIPWKSHWIIGTTDTDWHLDLAHPAATKADIDYILEHVNSVLAVPLTLDDIEGVYAGLRPLLAGESEQSSKLSREHAVARVAPGLIAIAGGKYTTYRVMGADAVDAAGEDLPGRINPSCTADVPLVGALGYQALVNQADRLAATHGVHPYRIRHLLDRYGSEIHELLAPAAGPDGDKTLLQPIPGAPDYLQAEALYAVTHEGALHVEDVLARRTRISIEYAHRGTESARRVADIMAGVLGWSGAQVDEEVAAYQARVDAERRSQTEPDDDAADKARLEAPEVRGRLASPVA